MTTCHIRETGNFSHYILLLKVQYRIESGWRKNLSKKYILQDVFLPLKKSRSCLIAVEIIELLAFDYYYPPGHI
jgi:hypothetical protein